MAAKVDKHRLTKSAQPEQMPDFNGSLGGKLLPGNIFTRFIIPFFDRFQVFSSVPREKQAIQKIVLQRVCRWSQLAATRQ